MHSNAAEGSATKNYSQFSRTSFKLLSFSRVVLHFAIETQLPTRAVAFTTFTKTVFIVINNS